MSYNSPIEIIESQVANIASQIEAQIEADVMRMVHSYHINVDRDELLRALQYDRNQYYAGYRDGKQAAMDSMVHCKECKYLYDGMDDYCCKNHRGLARISENSFCCYGERRPNENWIGTDNQSFVDHADVIDILSDMPTVDAVEVVHDRLFNLPNVSDRDYQNFVDGLHDYFVEAAFDDRSVGIFGMTEGETLLANALMEFLNGGAKMDGGKSE